MSLVCVCIPPESTAVRSANTSRFRMAEKLMGIWGLLLEMIVTAKALHFRTIKVT